MRFLFVVLFYFLDYYSAFCQIPKPFDRTGKSVYKVITVDDILSSHFLIEDGIFVDLRNSKINVDEMKNVRKISDPTLLRNIGVLDTTSVYSFINSNVTEFHDFIYRKVKTNLDYGMNIPLIIDSELMTPNKYHSLSSSDTIKIREVKYIPKSDAILRYNSKIAFGAIIVKMRQ